MEGRVGTGRRIRGDTISVRQALCRAPSWPSTALYPQSRAAKRAEREEQKTVRDDASGMEGRKEPSGVADPAEGGKVSKTGGDTVTAQEEEGTGTKHLT